MRISDWSSDVCSSDLYFGGHRRPFDERFANSTIAIDGETGKLRWSFQTSHHDLWDYDVPSQPVLADVKLPGGKVRRALVQATKRGERSEERRVGKECGSTCRSRGSPYN